MAEPTETTGVQSLPYPDNDNPANPPADAPLHMRRLAEAVEKRLFAVYNTASDRDTRLSGKLEEGLVAYLKDNNSMHFYTGSAWQQFYPVVVPAILSGTGVPSNAVGSNGDIFLKY